MRYSVKILNLIVAVAALFFAACSDHVDDLGSVIQPDKDKIDTIKDTVGVYSETIISDAVYAVSSAALLGKYEDPLFGTIKSDYMMEFYAPLDGIDFEPEISYKFLSVDSVHFDISFVYHSGDSLAPMGVSLYKLISPLTRNYYTNADPSLYCDMNDLWGQQTYTIHDTRKFYSASSGLIIRTLSVNMDTLVGRQIYEKWKESPETFQERDKLREYLPGFYVTTTYGNGSIIEVELSSLSIYYKYIEEWGNAANDADTILTRSVSLLANEEVIQLNNIQNTYPTPNPLLTDDEAVYLKTPAGVFTQIQFPLPDIFQKMEDSGSQKIAVNSAKLIVKGYSERETEFKYDFGRPPTILLIEKDSVESFFSDPQKRLYDNKTSFMTTWTSSNNSYSFTNLSGLLSHYISIYKEKTERGETFVNPDFVLIPVRYVSSTGSSGSATVTAVYNYLNPATAVLRKDMEFSYILSHYK